MSKSSTPPAKPRRGSDRAGNATRLRLLQAAETLMREQGYAAVTTRKLGEQAGVTPPLVHYYFASMDDLFVSLYRHHAEQGLQRVREALDTDDVPQALWSLNSDPIDAVLHVEFMALGNHRKVVMEEMKKHGETFRQIQHEVLTQYFRSLGIEPPMDPELIITLMASVGLLLALESQGGMHFGHDRARRYILDIIDNLTKNAN